MPRDTYYPRAASLTVIVVYFENNKIICLLLSLVVLMPNEALAGGGVRALVIVEPARTVTIASIALVAEALVVSVREEVLKGKAKNEFDK